MEAARRSHSLSLAERGRLTVTGVTEVVRFDQEEVVLTTEMGTLTVQGQQLQLKTLSAQGGQVTVEGQVAALSYAEPRQPGGWARRLFG